MTQFNCLVRMRLVVFSLENKNEKKHICLSKEKKQKKEDRKKKVLSINRISYFLNSENV